MVLAGWNTLQGGRDPSNRRYEQAKEMRRAQEQQELMSLVALIMKSAGVTRVEIAPHMSLDKEETLRATINDDGSKVFELVSKPTPPTSKP